MSIQLKNINKIYNKGKKNENHVLKDVSLTIDDGEMVAIIGRSGSGKSTLLHILGCLDTSSSGEYTLDGIHVNDLSEQERAMVRNTKIGYILQDFGLISEDTVLENVMLPMMFDDTPMGKIKQRALDALRQVEMEQLQGNKVATLSGGEKQRTAIARALVKNPEYILADEPTGALDTENAEIFMENLIHLHEIGKTIIMVTHDLELASRLNRTCRIVDGELIAE